MESLSIFVSSPGDVAQERMLTEGVIRRLQGEFRHRVRLEPIFWEHEPLVATDSFQDQIVRPSETDIVVCILWSRLGTRLPARFRRPDGTRYDSGTEYEFEDAVAGWKANGRPDLLVYRKTAEPFVSLLDRGALMEKLQQRQALDHFVERWFHDQQDGSLRAAYHQFETPEDFELTVERHLRRLIDRRAPREADTPSGSQGPEVEARWTEGSPFRGLEPFDEGHAEVFFGRTRAVSEVIDHLRAQEARGRPFVVVVGMSGGGKSSLVRAGVVPLLTSAGVIEGVKAWRRAILRPADEGGDPMLALAVALAAEGALPELAASGTTTREMVELARTAPGAVAPLIRAALDRVDPGARLLLVIDQLEELFSIRGLSEAERHAFADLVDRLVRSGRVMVIATLRSDLYPRLSELPELVALKEGQGQYDLLPPSASEITQMIRQPVAAAGLALEVDPATGRRLEDRLLDAAIGRPGTLPLLEFTLEELYRRRRPDGTLTLEAFDDLGGVEGSLARRAEEVFESLPGEVKSAFPLVMRQLVTVVENAEGTTLAARPAPLERLRDDDDAARLVDALIRARLLVTDLAQEGGAVVRVAHEALLRHWPRLTEWLEGDQELLKSRARLRAAAFRWAEAGRDDDLLLQSGKPLEDARAVVDAGSRLTELESAFVAGSERRARRFVQLRRAAFAAVCLFALVAGVSGWMARRSAERAEAQATAATRTHQFMVGLLSLAQPSLAQGQQTTVRDLLDAGRARLLSGELGDVPATGAWAMRDLAASYVSLGDLDAALALARAADSLAATDPAVSDSVRAQGWTLLGEVHQHLGNMDSASVHLDRAIAVWRESSPQLEANALTGLATVRRDEGDLIAYDSLLDRASLLGLTSMDTTGLDYAVTLSNEALRLLSRGEGWEADQLLQRADELWARYPGQRLADYAVLITHRARAWALQGDLVRADSLFRDALEIERRILPPGHPSLAVTLNNLALNAQELGDSVAAESWLRESVEVSQRALGADHPRTAAAMINLGEMLSHRVATWPEADSLLVAALDGLRRTAPQNEDVSVALQNRGALFRFRGQFDSALVHFEQGYRADSLMQRHDDAMFAAGRWAEVARVAGDTVQMERAVTRSFASARLLPGERARARALDELQDVLFNAEIFEASEEAAREAMELRRLHGTAPELANSLADVAWWEAVLGQRDSSEVRRAEALALAVEAQSLLDEVPVDDPEWLSAHQALSFAWAALDEHRRVARSEADAYERLRAGGHFADAVNALLRRGLNLEEGGYPEEALVAYREAEAAAVELLGPRHPLRATAAERVEGLGGG